MDLLIPSNMDIVHSEQLPDVGNNADSGKHRTSERKRLTSNDCSKRPRK